MSQEATPAPTRGVPVTLDKVRHLRYTLGTRKRLLQEIGGEEALNDLTGDKMAILLLYGLKHEDPDLTLEQVEEMVDLENLPVVVEAFAKAMGYNSSKVQDTGATGNPQ